MSFTKLMILIALLTCSLSAKTKSIDALDASISYLRTNLLQDKVDSSNCVMGYELSIFQNRISIQVKYFGNGRALTKGLISRTVYGQSDLYQDGQEMLAALNSKTAHLMCDPFKD